MKMLFTAAQLKVDLSFFEYHCIFLDNNSNILKREIPFSRIQKKLLILRKSPEEF